MGISFGLSLVKDGGEGRSEGRFPIARWIALCTSVAAASISLLSENCNTSELAPNELRLVIISIPGICMNCCSSGDATFDAITVGSAPGYDAVT